MKEEERPVYVIYRVYKNSRVKNYQYAWTHNKNLAKVFLLQRTEDKFSVVRTSREELAHIYSENAFEKERELHLRDVLSKRTGMIVPLAITDQEIAEARVKLHKIFSDLASPEGRTSDYSLNDMIAVFQNLRPEFIRILEFIGFRPPEMDSMFDSVEGMDPSFYTPEWNHSYLDVTPNWLKCLCSLEGYVLALREDF